jgi:hypothetical protein
MPVANRVRQSLTATGDDPASPRFPRQLSYGPAREDSVDIYHDGSHDGWR